MEKITVEIGKGLRDRLIKKFIEIQDELYVEQVMAGKNGNNEKKGEILKQFMNVTAIIQALEEWQLKDEKPI